MFLEPWVMERRKKSKGGKNFKMWRILGCKSSQKLPVWVLPGQAMFDPVSCVRVLIAHTFRYWARCQSACPLLGKLRGRWISLYALNA